MFIEHVVNRIQYRDVKFIDDDESLRDEEPKEQRGKTMAEIQALFKRDIHKFLGVQP